MGGRPSKGIRARRANTMPQNVIDFFEAFPNADSVLVRIDNYYNRYDRGKGQTDSYKFFKLDEKLPDMVRKGLRVAIMDVTANKSSFNSNAPTIDVTELFNL